MGAAVKIDSLARTMIELSGLVPDKDIAIEYTGLKPGEKLTEILSSDDEELGTTTHEQLVLVKSNGNGHIAIDDVDSFIESVRTLTNEEVKAGISRFVSEYKNGTPA
jgi:FlaA1/EpsC-like NDP-sugar epimerase